MKKLVIASLVALAATSASALELGVTANRISGDVDRSGYGVTLGHNFGKFGVEAGFNRFAGEGVDQNRFTVLGTMPVTSIGKVAVTAKAGVAYLDNSSNLTSVSAVTRCRGRSHRCVTSTSTTSTAVADGFAAVVGVGATLPLTNKLAVTADYRYQRGQEKVNAFNGSNVSVGLTYKF